MADTLDIPQPRENHRLFGHETVEEALYEACNAEHLHHSLLLAGPRGIGKATLAFRLARFLLKTESSGLLGLDVPAADGFDMLTDDPVFRQVAVGGHPALRVVERARNPDTGKVARDITVGDIRSLSEFFRMTTVAGGWRVAIVDPAEAMNQNAANALLKILEEPPDRSLIVLVSHAPGCLLPTIRSRCRVVQMSAPPREAFASALGGFALSPSDEDLAMLADLASGSVGEAIALLQLDGLSMYRDICELMNRQSGEFDRELDAFGDKLSRNGQDEAFDLFIRLMQRAIGDRITTAARNGASPHVGGELDRWLDVWEKVRVLLVQAGGLGLDRKHVILNAFLHVSSAAASAGTR